MTGTAFLIDKSALARMRHAPVRGRIAPLLRAGNAASCAIIDLEVLFSARDAIGWREMRRDRALAYRHVDLDENIFARAIDVQGQLARRGHHRLPIPDLIVAATAEAHDLVVLHYDKDFEIIAATTGQRVEWVVPRGSVP